LYLTVFLETTNISESFSIHALVNSRAIGVFINQSFVEKHSLNTYRLSKLIPLYNVDSIQNKAGQISKIVDIIL